MNPTSAADAKLRVMESKLAAARQAAAKSEQEARELTRQLRGVNNEVARLNRKLQEKATRMRKFQDELVKRGKLSQLG